MAHSIRLAFDALTHHGRDSTEDNDADTNGTGDGLHATDGGDGDDVAIGGELFSDAMGAEGSYEGTWLGMIDHNITTIAGALGGTVPERGMDGRLSAGF